MAGAPTLEEKYYKQLQRLEKMAANFPVLPAKMVPQFIATQLFTIIDGRVFKILKIMDGKNASTLYSGLLGLDPEANGDLEKLAESLANYHRQEKLALSKFRFREKVKSDLLKIQPLEQTIEYIIRRTQTDIDTHAMTNQVKP